MKKGIELIVSGILTIGIILGFQTFLPESSCVSVYDKFTLFALIMYILGIIVTSYGLYLFLTTNKLLKKKKHKGKR